MRKWLRRIGIVLLFVGAMSGARVAFVYFSEVPTGYRRVDFAHEITEAVHFDSEAKPHFKDSLLKLEGQKVFLKGQMYPEARIDGLTQFLLCKEQIYVGFGALPTAADYLHVELKDGGTARFRNDRMSVWGTFQRRRQRSKLDPLYEIVDASCEPSRSAF